MANLFLAILKDPAYKKITDAMNKFPLLIGGERQIDSLIMKHNPYKFIAKGGAEGLMMVLNLEKKNP